MFKFGRGSLKILNTVNKYLVIAAEKTIEDSKIDISIPEWGGLRTTEYQFKLYKKRWSRADGTAIKSRHQLMDEQGNSQAIDLCGYFDGKQTWNGERLSYIAGLMTKNFNILRDEGKIPYNLHIHWGGYWSISEEAKEDDLGWDKAHFELRTKPQTKIFV